MDFIKCFHVLKIIKFPEMKTKSISQGGLSISYHDMHHDILLFRYSFYQCVLCYCHKRIHFNTQTNLDWLCFVIVVCPIRSSLSSLIACCQTRTCDSWTLGTRYTMLKTQTLVRQQLVMNTFTMQERFCT